MASVAMQKAVASASCLAAWTTVAPQVAPASSTHRHMVPRSTGQPSRAKPSSMRNSGMPWPYLSIRMCASSDGAASERGKVSGGIGAVSIAVSPSVPRPDT